MGPTGNDVNVIQIHPNLSCKHCYSSSGPEGFYELLIDAAVDYLPFTNWYGIATTRSHHFAPVASDSINLPS